MRQRPSFGYKRFAKAAQAIRFAMEDMPRACLVGAFLEVRAEIRQRRHQPLVQKHRLSSNAAQCTMTERRSTSISIGE